MSLFLLLSLIILNGIIWYLFFYYLLYSIKKEVNIKNYALLLLIIFSLGIVTCPIVLNLIISHAECAMMMMK